MKNQQSYRYVVLGGGAMGRITARDLVEFAEGAEVVVADYNESVAKEVAGSLRRRGKKVLAAHVDATDVAATARLLDGSFAVLNCLQYQLNLKVMKAALAARCHYADLGGLFHVTRKQLELDRAFRRVDRLAALGMGASPGITNVLAAAAAERLDRVEEIHIKLGSIDQSVLRREVPFSFSYSIQTILEEFSYPPAIFTGGKTKFLKPMSGGEPYRFPAPVGWRRPIYTLHSEIATLPASFRRKGVSEVSFQIAFDDGFREAVRTMRDVGLASEDPILVDGKKVIPKRVLLAVLNALPKPEVIEPKGHEIVRAIVKGRRGKRAVTVYADCHVPGIPEWGVGVDVDTGCPPSIVAQMIADGRIAARGALPPEMCVPAAPFFKELKRRKMKVKFSEEQR